MKHRDLWMLLVISAFLDIFLLRNVMTIGLVQSADWPIPILSLKSLYYAIFPAWSFQDMAPNGLNIFLVLYGFSASVSHNPALIQKLFYFLPWSLSSISAFLLLKNIGLKKYSLIFFSVLYQFGPWINGQFMGGEPVNVMLYLFIPVILFVLLKYYKFPKKLFIYLTLAMLIPSFFTLESSFFYMFLIFPFFMYLIFSKKIYGGLRMILSSGMSLFAIIIFNIYSLTPYITSFTGTASESSSLISSFTQFPPAVAAKYWMLAFLAVSWISLYLARSSNKTEYGGQLLWFCVVSTLLVAIYPGLGFTGAGVFLLERFPLLAPFINPNEFLLYTWIVAFLTVSYSLMSWYSNSRYSNNGKSKHFLRQFKGSVPMVASIGIALLLISSAVVEIQSFGSHDTGIYLFSQGTHFQKTEIQPQYSNLYDFLIANNASFGLSYHTIVFPENPNYTLPYYIGQQMLPGYIGLFSKNVSSQIINGINGNDSNFLMLLSLMGVKYLAVMDTPGSTWFGTHGSPQLSMWGSNYIFIGNYSSYLCDLNRLSGLKMVEHSEGLWVFENLYYESPVLSAKSTYFSDVARGNYCAMYNTTPVSGNIINSSHFYYSGSNFSVTGNLSFSIARNSSGVFAYSYLYLLPNSTYMFSFSFNTTGTSDTYYGSGQNVGMIFYNVTPSSSNIIGGAVISVNPEISANGFYRNMFRTPDFNSPLPAKVLFQLQPPLHHEIINVSVGNTSIVRINGSNMFFNIFEPVQVTEAGPTSFVFSNLTSGDQISIDQIFGGGWSLEHGNGTKISAVPNALGMLSFSLNVSGNATVGFIPQFGYTVLIYISFVSISVFLVALAVYSLSRKLRNMFRV